MTQSMKRFLTLASNPKGIPVMKYEDYRTASNNGWVRAWGIEQNSMCVRYVITDEGRAALAAA